MRAHICGIILMLEYKNKICGLEKWHQQNVFLKEMK